MSATPEFEVLTYDELKSRYDSLVACQQAAFELARAVMDNGQDYYDEILTMARAVQAYEVKA